MDASTWTTDGRATGVNEGSGAGATSISSPTASSGIEPAGPSPEEEFRSRVNSFVEDVVKAGKKRKQVYSVTSATVISIRDGLAEVAKRVEDCTTMKSSIVKEMKALVDTIDVGGAKKRHRSLHGSIAKVGKSIDRNFPPDENHLCFSQEASPPPARPNDGAVPAVTVAFDTPNAHLDRAVAMHIVRESGGKVEGKGLSDFVASACGPAQKTSPGRSRRTPKRACAKAKGKQGPEGGATPDSNRLFQDMSKILDDMKRGALGSSLDWTTANGGSLPFPQAQELEFNLRSLEYTRMLSKNQLDDAVKYSQLHFPRFIDTHGDAIQMLMGCIVFPGASGQERYAALQSPEAWAAAAHVFKAAYCAVNNLPLQSPLAAVVNVAAVALPQFRQMGHALAVSGKGKPVEPGPGGSGDPPARPEKWWDLKELPVEIDVGPTNDSNYHSLFTCPVSREQATPENPPVLLTCGHAICKDSMRRIAGTRVTFKCPYCPVEMHLSHTVEMFI